MELAGRLHKSMNLDQFIAHAESDVSTVEFDSAAYLRNGLVTNSPFPEQDAHHWEYVRFVGREGQHHFYFRSYKWYENFSATILERVNDLAFDDNVASFILTLTTDAKLITRAEYTDASNDPNWSVFHTISFYPREDVPIWMKSDCILGIHTFPVGTSARVVKQQMMQPKVTLEDKPMASPKYHDITPIYEEIEVTSFK